MKQLGLSPSESALIYGTVPFLGAIVRPIIGAVADKLHAHKVSDNVLCIKLNGGDHYCHCSSMLCNRKEALWMQMDFGNCLFVTLFEMVMSTKSGSL